MSIGQRLRIWGKKHYKKMTKLAEVLDIDYSTLQRYLSDKRRPSPEVLTKLNELGCDINLLLTGENEPDHSQRFEKLVNIVKESQSDYYIRIPRKEYDKMNERITELEEENKVLKKKIASSMKSLQ
jgi:transcriptional regulator with XRE-family HTH domain